MADPREQITVSIGEAIHRGWKANNVQLSLEQLSGSCSLTLTDVFAEGGKLKRFPVASGQRCAVNIGGETVMTGHIDVAPPTWSSADKSIAVTIRDLTADLADSCAEPATFNDQRLPAIAEALCRRFGIRVKIVNWDGGPVFPSYAVDPGEKISSTLEDACRQVGALMWTDGLGNLMIGRPSGGAHVGTLRLVDCKDITGGDDHSQRYHTYKVVGGKADDDGMDDDGHAVAGIAIDPEIRASRLLVIVAENKLPGAASAQERADWEARVRRARGRKIDVTRSGWWAPNGALWRPGQRLKVDHKWWGRFGTLMVASVDFGVTPKDGKIARVSLLPEGAFDPIADGIKPGKGGDA